MKPVSDKFKKSIKKYGRQIDAIITYTDKEGEHLLDSNVLFSITPTVNGNILKSVMKQLEFESSVKVPKGAIIKAQLGVQIDLSLTVAEINAMLVERLKSTSVNLLSAGLKGFEYITFGNYIVSEEPEYNADTLSYYHKCYDKMLYSMKEYEKLSITYPISIRDYLKKICSHLGLTFKNANDIFANYNKQIKLDLYDGYDYTFRDILDELAQVTASTICINENTDELEIRYLNNTQDSINEDYLKDVNVEFGEMYGPINSIVLSRSGESDNVYLLNEKSIEENGLCELKILDNQIMNDNDRSDYLPDILSKLNGVSYCINDFSSYGITWYDLCDLYTIKIGTKKYNCILLNDEIKITQGLEETIYTEMPVVSETDYTKADKTDRRINKAYIIVDKQNQKIEALVSQQTKTGEKLSKVEQTVDGITQKVKNIEVVTNTVSGTKMLELENCVAGSLLELHIHGNNEVFNNQDRLIKVCTRNICSTQIKDWEQGSFSGSTGETMTYSNSLRLVNMIEIDNTEITLSVQDNNYCLYFIYIYDSDKNYLGGYSSLDGQKTGTIKLASKTKYINITLKREDGAVINPVEIANIKPQIEYGSEKTEFIEHNTQLIELGVTEALRKNDEVEDEYILSNGQAQVTRRVNADGTTKVTPTTEDLGECNVSLAEGTNTIEIKNYTANMEAKYVIKNAYTDTFATKVETESSITQTAEEINIEVRKKVDENEIISSINQSPEQITIQAEKININGTVSANGNFKVSTEGNMECTDATINGGNITINNNATTYNEAKLKVNSASTQGYMSASALELYYHDLWRGVALAVDGIQGGNQIIAYSEGGDAGIGFGEIWADGNIYGANISSDKRLKENITETSINAIEIIKKMGIKSFDWKGSKKHINAGYIAQEMEEIDENFVLKKPVTDKDGQIIDYKYYMNELPIVATLTKAFQEQQEIIESLQKEVKEIKEGKR